MLLLKGTGAGLQWALWLCPFQPLHLPPTRHRQGMQFPTALPPSVLLWQVSKESTDEYVGRMQGYLLLLAAITQSDNPANPHGLAQAWAFLARWVAVAWLGRGAGAGVVGAGIEHRKEIVGVLRPAQPCHGQMCFA